LCPRWQDEHFAPIIRAGRSHSQLGYYDKWRIVFTVEPLAYEGFGGARCGLYRRSDNGMCDANRGDSRPAAHGKAERARGR